MTAIAREILSSQPWPGDVQDTLRAHAPTAADLPVRWAARSNTLGDTGRGFRRAPLFAAILGDRFALVATGPRPLVRVVPAAALGRAVYNHVTGELAFPPVTSGPPFPSLRLDPLVARSLLTLSHDKPRDMARQGDTVHA
jgi:hypothetical protein